MACFTNLQTLWAVTNGLIGWSKIWEELEARLKAKKIRVEYINLF